MALNLGSGSSFIAGVITLHSGYVHSCYLHSCHGQLALVVAQRLSVTDQVPIAKYGTAIRAEDVTRRRQMLDQLAAVRARF